MNTSKISGVRAYNPKLEISNHPITVSEAVERLLLVLSADDTLTIATMEEKNLIDLHLGLGMAIRNAWLHKPANQLLASCCTSHPDDASSAIICALWRALKA